jgi:hypothetical protein
MTSARLSRSRRRMLGLVGAVLASCGIGVSIVLILALHSAGPGAQVTVERCRSNMPATIPSAMVAISSQTATARTFYVEIGFDHDGRQVSTGSVRERVPPLGVWIGFVVPESPPGIGVLTCTVLQVANEG